MTNDEKVIVLCSLIEQQQNARLATQFQYLILPKTIAVEVGVDNIGNHGRFYKIWDQNLTGSNRSVRYFVEKSSGIIFGAKSWKAHNPNHQYGTLDTIGDWDWSGYYAAHKEGKPSLVPKTKRIHKSKGQK